MGVLDVSLAGGWGVSQESCTHFRFPAPMTSWPPTLLTEFIIFCLHLLLIPVTVVVIVRVMLHVLEAETGHDGHVRTHLLGAPVGRDGGGSAGQAGEGRGPAQG